MDLGGVKAKPFVSGVVEEEGEVMVVGASAMVRELARRLGYDMKVLRGVGCV